MSQVPNLNHRQAVLLIQTGMMLAHLIDQCGFDASKAVDRHEVLDVLEELHKQMYDTHVEIMTRRGYEEDDRP